MLSREILKDKLFCAGFGLGAFFILLTLWYGLAMDQSIACYTAWVWKQFGLPPYLGTFEHNFPGMFLISRLAFSLFGETIISLRILDCLAQLSCLTMIFLLAKKLAGTSAAGFMASVFYGICYFGLGPEGTAQRESFKGNAFLTQNHQPS